MAAAEQRGFADQLQHRNARAGSARVRGCGSRQPVCCRADRPPDPGWLYFVFILFGAIVFGAVANRINLLGKWVLAAFIGLNFLLIWGYYTL